MAGGAAGHLILRRQIETMRTSVAKVLRTHQHGSLRWCAISERRDRHPDCPLWPIVRSLLLWSVSDLPCSV